MTVNASTLTRQHFANVGVTDEQYERLTLVGLEHTEHFYPMIVGDIDHLEPALAEREVVAAAVAAVRADASIAAFVFECTNLPPYAAAVTGGDVATGLGRHRTHPVAAGRSRDRTDRLVTGSDAEFHGGPVVIIGAGIVGCSLAFHLARHGHTDVTVLDAGSIGEGSTAKATGGIRQQFSSEINASIAHEAVGYFEHFEDLVGEPFEFRQHGYLFLLGSADQYAQFERNVAMQQRLGVDVRLLPPDELDTLVPGVNCSDLFGGAYSPDDGSGSPADAVVAFARQARRRGVTIAQQSPVRRRGP